MAIKNTFAIILTALFVLSSIFFVHADDDVITELPGDWLLQQGTDEMNDKKSTVAVYFTNDGNAILRFGCIDGDTTLVSFQIRQYIDLSGEYADIEYRIDKNKSIETKWVVISDGYVLAIRKREAIILLRKLYQGNDVFLFRIRRYNYDSVLVKIPLTYIKEPIELVAKQCNWSPEG